MKGTCMLYDKTPKRFVHDCTFRIILPLTFAAAFASSLGAASYSFQTINNPADNSLQTPTFNQLLGINNEGVIAGYYGDGVTVNNHGFTYAGGTFTAENVSGTDQTQVVAINNTKSGGAYQTAGFSVINSSGLNQGFTNVGGTFTNINGPGSTFTQALGLNDKSQVVGFYNDAAGVTHGFQSNLTGGGLTTLNLSPSLGAVNVTATGINNSGLIVGFFTTCAGCDSGFIYNPTLGTTVAPTDPNDTNPMFFGINNLGEIVGTDTSSAGSSEGFVYNMTTQTWTYISDPNSVTTTDGFGLNGTTLNGINDLGQVVGFYADAAGNVDGFVATPVPEPASFALAGLALAGCLFWRRRPARHS